MIVSLWDCMGEHIKQHDRAIPGWWIFSWRGLMCEAVMLRRLLACLALLTGLAAAGTPAQANPAGSDIARVEASVWQSAGDSAEAAPAAAARRVFTKVAAKAIGLLGEPYFCEFTSVRTGIDRARE